MRRCDEAFQEEPDSVRIAKNAEGGDKRDFHCGSVIIIYLPERRMILSLKLLCTDKSLPLLNSFSGYCDPVAVFGDIDL